MSTSRVSMVVCTHQRLAALRENMPRHLAVRGVSEVVVVVDGSTDGSAELLHALAQAEPRLRVIRLRQSGPVMARRAGIDASTGDWVFLIDDDDLVPEDHVEILLTVAGDTGGDIVAAPRVYVPERDAAAALARHRMPSTARFGLYTAVTSVPPGEVENPFLCSTALVHRRVFRAAHFDPGYGGNAWREETDFFVSAAVAGFRPILTPRTFGYCPRRWTGGIRRSRWWYAWWCWRNNGRFLRKPRNWLRAHGHPASLVLEQTRYAGELLVTRSRHGSRCCPRGCSTGGSPDASREVDGPARTPCPSSSGTSTCACGCGRGRAGSPA